MYELIVDFISIVNSICSISDAGAVVIQIGDV